MEAAGRQAREAEDDPKLCTPVCLGSVIYRQPGGLSWTEWWRELPVRHLVRRSELLRPCEIRCAHRQVLQTGSHGARNG